MVFQPFLFNNCCAQEAVDHLTIIHEFLKCKIQVSVFLQSGSENETKYIYSVTLLWENSSEEPFSNIPQKVIFQTFKLSI